ncbi:MAG: hypothetical protein E3K37_05535 [Candidatus Kuenenia sp.]|nr:hypothetical protein [Candidatus Kuenenia hertensis]
MIKKHFLLFLMYLIFVYGLSCSTITFNNKNQNDNCLPVIPHGCSIEHRYQTLVKPFHIVAPSGNKVYGLIRCPSPRVYPNQCFPALIIIPGALEPGRMHAYGLKAKSISEAGIVVVCFNAEGRVSNSSNDITSEGNEDYNGFRHQDGLAEIIKYVKNLDYVIDENIGIYSQSYGISMVAGCVARRPEISVKYIIDIEGPSDSFAVCLEPWTLDRDVTNDMSDKVYRVFGHYSLSRDNSEENMRFWAEREAVRYIGKYRGNYLRIQGTWDHILPPKRERDIKEFTQYPLWWQNKHAVEMVNAAVKGGVPWVRINLIEQGNSVNKTYHYNDRPHYLPGSLAESDVFIEAIIELIRAE